MNNQHEICAYPQIAIHSDTKFMRPISSAVIALIFTLLPFHAAYSYSVADLPQLLEKLSSNDHETVTSTLEILGRICDETCVPYIQDMLHHHQMEVVTAACKTAGELANPAFSPALLELVRNFPADSVKFEAIKALTSIGTVYEALLLNVNPDHPDEIQRQIIRSLPEHMLSAKASLFAQFAGHHELSTSVAKAYQHAPQALFPELFSAIPSAPKDAKRNLLRTVLMLAQSTHGSGISEQQAVLFNDDPTDNLDVIAAIQSERSTPDAIRWLLAWMPSFNESTLLDILTRIHPRGSAQFTDAILQAEPPHLPTIIDANPALKKAFIEKLSPSNKSCQYAITLLKTPYRESALSLLVQNEDFAGHILSELGKTDPHHSISALHIIADSPKYLPKIAQTAAEPGLLDNFDQAFLARWAFILIHSNYPDETIPMETLENLRHTALSLIQTPQKLHAEPAFWILKQLGETLSPPPVEVFQNLRSDMQRAWLREIKPESALPYLQIALEHTDESIVAQALEYLTVHQILAPQIQDFGQKIIHFIQSDSPILSVQASATAALLGRTECISELQNRLTSTDTRIAYNALWALQKLHALPNKHWLNSLYFRAPDGVLKERLGFLTGLKPDSTEQFPMSELKTLRPLKKGQIVQFTSQNEPLSNQDIAVIQDDQSLRIYRTNSFGMIFL